MRTYGKVGENDGNPKIIGIFWGGMSGNKGKMQKNGWNCQDVYEVGAVLAETCENPIAMIPLKIINAISRSDSNYDGTWWNSILPYFRYPKKIPKGSWSTKKAPRVPSPSLAFFICPSSPWLGGTCYIAASKQPYLLGFGLPGYRNCMEFLGCEKSEWYRKNI